MRILIVEDQALLALSLELVLTAAGHKVIGPASSSSEALQLAASEAPAIAFVDIDLETSGAGIELARRLHQKHAMCVVLTTGRPELARTSDCAFGLLSKPYNPELAATCIPLIDAVLHARGAKELQPPSGFEVFAHNLPRIRARAMTKRPILVIENQRRDAEITLAALERASESCEIILARDGVDALEYLEALSVCETLPRLVLLDIRMPRIDGFEVLQRIKSSPQWRSIPVVMFSSSRAEDDVLRAYAAGANAFVFKPDDFARFTETLTHVDRFWSRHNRSSPRAERDH